MMDREKSQNGNKRRKLDELFADEPYLSATMKANRLHEKLKMLEEQERAAQGLPTEAYVVDRNSSPERLTTPNVLNQPHSAVVIFQQAKRYYSEGLIQGLDRHQIHSLDLVRNTTIAKWLENQSR